MGRKTNLLTFLATSKRNITQEKLDMAKKRKSYEKKQIFSDSSAYNAIRTNYVKVKIDKVQQNSRCRVWGDNDETIDHMISKCCKLVHGEYKARHDRVEKVILWDLYEGLKFDHTNKWFMHNLERVLENETHKILWDSAIQTDSVLSARRPNLVIVTKKKKKKRQKTKENLSNSGLCCSGLLESKTEENEKRYKYPNLDGE